MAERMDGEEGVMMMAMAVCNQTVDCIHNCKQERRGSRAVQ